LTTWQANGQTLFVANGTGVIEVYPARSSDQWQSSSLGTKATLTNGTVQNLAATDTGNRVFTVVSGAAPVVIDTTDNWTSAPTVTNLPSNSAVAVDASADGEMLLYYSRAASLLRVARRAGGPTSTTYNTVADLILSAFTVDIAWMSSDGRRVVSLAQGASSIDTYNVASLDDWNNSTPRIVNGLPFGYNLTLLNLGCNADLTVVVFQGFDGGLRVTRPVVVATTDNWTAVNIQQLPVDGDMTGGGVALNGQIVAVGDDVGVRLYKSTDLFATYSLFATINPDVFPQLGVGFQPDGVMAANKGGNFEYLAIPDVGNSVTHVFDVTRGPTPVTPALEELILEGDVILSGTDSILGPPPGRDLSVTAIDFATAGRVGRDAFFSTLHVGQPSPVIGSVPKDAGFTHVGTTRLV